MAGLTSPSTKRRTLTNGSKTANVSFTSFQKVGLNIVAVASFPFFDFTSFNESHLLFTTIFLNWSFFSCILFKVRKYEVNLVTPGLTSSFPSVKYLKHSNVLVWPYTNMVYALPWSITFLNRHLLLLLFGLLLRRLGLGLLVMMGEARSGSG